MPAVSLGCRAVLLRAVMGTTSCSSRTVLGTEWTRGSWASQCPQALTGRPEAAGPVQEDPGPRPTGQAVFIRQKPGQEARPFPVTFRRGRTTDEEVATSLGAWLRLLANTRPLGERGHTGAPMPEEGEAESQQLDSPDTTARTTPRPRETEGSQSRGSRVTGAGARPHPHPSCGSRSQRVWSHWGRCPCPRPPPRETEVPSMGLNPGGSGVSGGGKPARQFWGPKPRAPDPIGPPSQ